MRVGDLVRTPSISDRIGIVVDWHVVYDRFGDAVEKFAVVSWDSSVEPEQEYLDMLEVISESHSKSNR